MKNWKKYALASASVLTLGATLAACGNLTGDNQKSSKSEDGKTVIKMYQIGDKPDNLDTLLENANKIIEEKAGVNRWQQCSTKSRHGRAWCDRGEYSEARQQNCRERWLGKPIIECD